MEMQVNNISPVNWENLNNERKIIAGFLKSLNEKSIGTGLVYTDGFKLLPRSNYFNSTKLSSITSMRVPTATFDDTQNTFVQLITKTEQLIKGLESFKPYSKDDCSSESFKFFFKMVNMRSTIKLSSENGLKQLSDNYLNLGKKENSISLNEIGTTLFKKIDTLFDSIYGKLLEHHPDLKKDIDLEQYELRGKNLLRKRDRYCEHARTVGWALDNGVRIPRLMLLDSHKNVMKELEYSKTAIKSVAEFIKLPSNAMAVPAQNGSVEWIPVRPEVRNDQIYFEKGVMGTCERVNHQTLHLCNLYYKRDAERITISTSAVDTALKGKELIKLLLELTAENKQGNTRWILHQLNSITMEKELVKNVQAQVQEIEPILKENRDDFCLMHVNTAFNAAAGVSSEDLAVTEINIHALVQIAQIIRTEITSFLTKANFDFKPNEWILFHSTCSGIAALLNNNNECFFQEPNSVQLEGSINAEKKVLGNQTDHQEQLKTLRKNSKQLIENLHTHAILNPQFKCYYERAILILQTFEHILALQLKLEGAPALSRTSEIELFLMLYRFLNINPIISCDGGLDRTVAIAAIDDTLSQLQKELYKGKFAAIMTDNVVNKSGVENFKEAYDEYEKNLSDKDRAMIELATVNEIYKTIFDLITNLDENRKTIFKLINALPENAWFFVNPTEGDLDKMEKSLEGKDIGGFRQKIIAKIGSQEDQEKAKLLNTLHYLEIFAAHLLGAQQEKIFYSTGVFGFKYHYNNGWTTNLSANPYPLDRLPPYIFTENDTPVPLFTYTEGWRSTTITLTKLAETLIFRLSKLRAS